jgi:LacI family transcriptional regulator
VVAELTLLQKYMPVVVLNPPIEGFACTYLYNDLAGAMRQAIRHLQALGHRRIAFLGGSSEIGNSGIRGRLFLEEAAAYNLMPVTQYHHEAGHTPEAGELAVLKLLSRLERPAWPTALIAINDLVALGALRPLHRMELHVPDDRAIIGCDHQFFSPLVTPPLTTIDLQAAEHARTAVQVLLGEQRQIAPHFTQVREATLTVRESCGVKLGRRKFG